MDRFVSLHNQTYWSLMNALSDPKDLFYRAKELGQPALAITDYATMASAWDALLASRETGVKLIMGCNFNFVEDLKDSNANLRHVILLAKNHVGYKNILKASRLAYENHIVMFKKVVPRIDWDILKDCSEGVVCITSGNDGIISRLINTRKRKEAVETAKRLKDIFGENLALEVQPHNMQRNASPYNDYEDQGMVNRMLVKIGDDLGIKIIAACNSHYIHKADHEAHDVQLCIGTGQPVRAVARPKYSVPDFYLKSREEVESFFERLYKERAAEFCENTLYIADMCENAEWVDPKYSNPSGKELPTFPVKDEGADYDKFLEWLKDANLPPTIEEDEAYLRYWCAKEFSKKVPEGKEAEYQRRLEEELMVIEKLGFSSYMLIVADLRRYAKNMGVPVGPGRGSVAGCLLGYIVGIHHADPLKYGLIFERFLNIYKKEYPDVDMDFGSSGRDIVKEYIVKKYGAEYVAHVSNIITMTPKPYARDISRAFQFGGDRKKAVEVGNAIADSIPVDIHTVSDALKHAPLFIEYANQPKYGALRKFANCFEKVPKAWGTHAGGVIIGKRPLSEIVPIRIDDSGQIAVEYEKERAEANGLVKMDILAVSSLDVIQKTLSLIRESGAYVPINEITDYDANDKKTYDLIASGDTLGVFQLGESSGTIRLCKQIEPKSIEDLAVINALARPNAKDIRDDFIRAWQGGEKVKLIHPNLKRSFEATHGFAVFEECLMFMAQDIAGWNMTEADRLRKLTKDKGKNPEKVAKWREDFIDSSVEKVKMDRKVTTKIWDEIIDKFQGYAFNKSHAICYSFLSYQTAYLKAHYPLEFMTAFLMNKVKKNTPKDKDKVLQIKRELRQAGIKILPPDINASDKEYKIVGHKSLMSGFNSLKNIGKDAIPDLLEKRPFSSFEHLLSKIDGRKTRVPSIQSLAASGCLDSFGHTRKEMFLYAKDYRDKLKAWEKRKTEKAPFEYPWPQDVGEWSAKERYALEVFYMGESLTHTVKEAYGSFFSPNVLDFSRIQKIFPDPGNKDDFEITENVGSIEGVVRHYHEWIVKNEKSAIFGELMGKFEIEDPFGNFADVVLFPSSLVQIKKRLKELTRGKVDIEPGIAVCIAGSVSWYQGVPGFKYNNLKRVMPEPPVPSDLKHKKVSLRVAKKKKAKKKKADRNEILDLVQDDLILSGKDN